MKKSKDRSNIKVDNLIMHNFIVTGCTMSLFLVPSDIR